MTDEVQKTLENFDQAEEMDILGAKYFKPLDNIEYRLTFKGVKGETGHPAWQLRQVKGRDEIMCAVLVVNVASIDGKPVTQEFSIWNPKLRAVFQTPCLNGDLLLKKYKYKQSGKPLTYSFFEDGVK